MSIEDRLRDAFGPIDEFDPSPDLFKRLDRSLAEDRALRRRRMKIIVAILVEAAAVITWVTLSAEEGMGGNVFIDGWRLAVAFLVVAVSVIASLGPHIRRFGRGLVDEVFRLSPDTGARFLAVLDVAFYMTFGGLALADADMWGIGHRLLLSSALEDTVFRLGLLLLVMGSLHALNIALLPVLGVVFSSIVRLDQRRRAGSEAPPESLRARVVDRNARSIAIGLAVAAVALAVTFLGGPIGAGLGYFS